MTPQTNDVIARLSLQPHPEGGYFRETYRSSGTIPYDALPDGFKGDRSVSTAILYLLAAGDFSGFHRIQSDEIWHFHLGGALLVHEIDEDGVLTTTRVGPDVMLGEQVQYVVEAGRWFAAEPADGTHYVLVGCTVAPGFAFEDFEMADPAELAAAWPAHQALIRRLGRAV